MEVRSLYKYVNFMVYYERIFKTDNKHLHNVLDTLHPCNSILNFKNLQFFTHIL